MNQHSTGDRALECFTDDYCCSQAVFATIAPGLGLDRDTALRIASSFCGGMGQTARTCGAVTGAFMAIGLGRGSSEADADTREEAYRLVHEFITRFTAKHGTIECRDLLGCDIGTPEGRAQAEENNLYREVCDGIVCSAAEIVAELVGDGG